MGLRGINLSHFIWAIKNGLVVKVWNIGVGGKPKLKMKSLQDIYRIGQKTFASTPLELEVGKLELPFDLDGVKDKSECIPVVDQKTIACDLQSYVYNDSADGDSDDFDSFNMTLNQLKDVCGSTKRKLSLFINIDEENKGTSHCANPEPDDDDLDLNMPLVKLKSKKEKNSKRKKCKIPRDVVAVVEADEMKSKLKCLRSDNELLVSDIDMKFKVAGPHDANSSNMICDVCDSYVQCSNLGIPTNECVSEFRDSISPSEVQNCIVANAFLENTDGNEPIPSNKRDDNREIVREVISESSNQQSPQLLVVEQKENCIIDEDGSGTYDQLSPLSALENQEGMNFNHLFFDEASREAEATSLLVRNFDSSQNLHPCLISDEENSPKIIENQSSTPLKDVTPIKAVGIRDFDANNKPVLLLTSSPCHSGVRCAPERLLSTRKSISPASQKSLMQDVKYMGLDGDEMKCKSKVRLQFGETPEKVASLDVSNSHSKGILKVTPKSCAMSSPGLSPLQSCSQSAIAFSQRQMHDIESVACKLTTQVKSMKDILERKLHSQESLDHHCGEDEVRLAIQNATKAEKATRKWMTIMTRDCTRFCKIMEVADEHGVGCSNINEKVRKKITFADEVGQVLCDIKMFSGETII